MSDRQSDIERAARWLAEARRIVALTGAGISIESGIPTCAVHKKLGSPVAG